MKPISNTQYIYTLPAAIQLQIEAELHALNVSNEDIQLAMNSRLCDLTDTIDINVIQ